jgi:Sulfotransferase domain
MSFPPAAFIIGAQRAGTTSLSAILDQHPGIVVSAPKEPDFFSVNWESGLDWYRSCFRRLDATLIDASVSYSMVRAHTLLGDQPDVVPRRIHEVSPQARFVYMVRDPAERCYSAYWHEKRAGRESLSLQEAVHHPRYYVMASYYYKQIQLFLKHFPLDRFLFVSFAEFARDPLLAASRCSEFFGLQQGDFTFHREEPRNQAFVYSALGLRLRNLAGEERLKTLSNIVSTVLPSSLHPYAKRMVTRSIPEMTSTEYRWLTDHFAEDAAAFERLTGVRVIAASDTTQSNDRAGANIPAEQRGS